MLVDGINVVRELLKASVKIEKVVAVATEFLQKARNQKATATEKQKANSQKQKADQKRSRLQKTNG